MSVIVSVAYLHFRDTSAGGARADEVRDGAHAQRQGQGGGAVQEPLKRSA